MNGTQNMTKLDQPITGSTAITFDRVWRITQITAGMTARQVHDGIDRGTLVVTTEHGLTKVMDHDGEVVATGNYLDGDHEEGAVNVDYMEDDDAEDDDQT